MVLAERGKRVLLVSTDPASNLGQVFGLKIGEHEPTAVPGAAGLFALDINPAWCKGCDICVKMCPELCLRLNDRQKAELIDASLCTGCHICEWLCPDFAIKVNLVPQAEATH